MRSSCRSGSASILAATGAIVLAIVVSGCGGDDEEPTPAPTEEEQGAEEPEPEEPAEQLTGAALGERVFAQEACNRCHSISSGAGPGHGSGPPLGGLYRSEVVLDDGTTLRVDEDYLKRSIEDPDAQIVRGFSRGAMSGVVPPGSISGKDVKALVEYLTTLR